MERIGIEFMLKGGEKIIVELTATDAANGSITGWWLYRDGESRLNEVETAIAYRRTVTSPNQQ